MLIEIGPGTQRHIRQPVRAHPSANLCVQSRERSAVAGVHGLQQVVAAFVADFAHDDAVGTMAESGGDKLAWSDGNLAGNRIDRLPANGIGMGDLQLGWLLDHDQPFMQRNMVEQRLHQGRLARAGSTADDAVLPLPDKLDNGIPNRCRQAARCNQLIGGKPAVEFAHGERRAVDRRGRADDGDARAVRQARIEDRILAGQVLPKNARDALNRGLQAVVACMAWSAGFARPRRRDLRRLRLSR